MPIHRDRVEIRTRGLKASFYYLQGAGHDGTNSSAHSTGKKMYQTTNEKSRDF